MGLPGFQRLPSARDMLFDPGGAVMPRDSNGITHAAFAYRHSLGLRDVSISWLNHIPPAAAVYASDTHVTMGTRKTRFQPAR